MLVRKRRPPEEIIEDLPARKAGLRPYAGPPVPASDTITFIDAAERIKVGFAFDSIAFTDAATESSSSGVSDSLALADIAAAAGSTFNRTANDVLTFSDAAFAFVEQSVCSETYDPGLGILGDVVLTFPFVTPTSTCTLRVPKFGNSSTEDLAVRVAKIRTGSATIARNPNWPQVKAFKVSFEALTKDQITSFLAFLQASQGQEIGYLDHENRQWRGIILSQTATITEEGSKARHDTGFEFQGVVT